MGVYHRNVLLYGWQVPYSTVSEWDWEEREQWYYDEVGEGEVGLVFDGMGGEYALIGIIQLVTDSSRSGQPSIPLTKVEVPSNEKQQMLFRTVFQEMDLDVNEEPEHYVLSDFH